MTPKKRIGKVYISTKSAKISVIEGEFEDIKYKLKSGILGKHSKGGQSSQRFARNRNELVNQFFKLVRKHMDKLDVSRWIFEGDKEIIKKLNRRGSNGTTSS